MGIGVIGVKDWRYKIMPYLPKKILFKDFEFRCKCL